MASQLTRGIVTMAALTALLLTGGCNTVLLNASGDIARQQGNLILVSTFLMALIIVPVLACIVVFAWRYRKNNTDATYKPDWNHSTQLELVIWGAPLLIIIALGLVTWITTHTLDPYRPLTRLDASRPVPAGTKPLLVEVVALDWKWLFIYPELGIASVNELATPVDVPVRFKITASSVMNSFYIPALAGQIYAMPGMETSLYAVLNKQGVYDGFSANYSGAGFSDMRFKLRGMDQAGFERWVETTRAGGGTLDRGAYLSLEKPTIKEPVRRYATVAPDLYGAILNRCVAPGTTCMSTMMAAGGHEGHGGHEGNHDARTEPAAAKPAAQVAQPAQTVPGATPAPTASSAPTVTPAQTPPPLAATPPQAAHGAHHHE